MPRKKYTEAERPTLEELKERARKKYPYEIGNGTHSLQKQSNYLKDQMRKYGYPVIDPRHAVAQTTNLYG